MELTPQMIGVIGLIVLVVLMFLRVPVAYSMMFVGLVGVAFFRNYDAASTMTVTMLYSKFTSYSFSAVPMFIFMGFLAYYAGILETLFDAAKKWIGHIHGGLISAGIIGGAGFGALSGSASASCATLSRVVIPELLKSGASRPLTYGSVAASALLDPLIPPSVLGMLISVVLEVSIGKVLIGGTIPGILCTIGFVLYTYFYIKRHPEEGAVTEKASWKARFKSLVKIWDFAVIILVVVLGIYLGWFSPTEAGAVSCAVVLVILAIKRRLNFKLIVDALVDTVKTTATVFFVVGTSFSFAAFLTLTRLPNKFSTWIAGLNVPPLVIIFAIAVFFIVVGMFMDAMPVIYIAVPIMAPVVSALGYDLVWFAVILLLLAVIGGITPPFGGNLFIVKASVPDSTIAEIYKGAFPYVIISCIVLVICILFPNIILFFTETIF